MCLHDYCYDYYYGYCHRDTDIMYWCLGLLERFDQKMVLDFCYFMIDRHIVIL